MAGPEPALKRGDVIQGYQKGVIVKISRGLVRSAYVFWEDGATSLVTEVDHWHRVGNLKFVSRKPKNLQFAKDYCRLNQNVPDL